MYFLQVIKTLKRALQPVISDVSIAWDLAQGWTVHQIPSSLPPLFSGDRLVVYGLLKPSENASQDGKNEVKLEGDVGKDEKMEHLFTFSAPPTTAACNADVELNSSVFLHRLAAKAFIQVKQDALNDVYSGGQEFEEAKTPIISVSKSAYVVSKFTSFVAVDRDNHEPVAGPLVSRKQYLYQCSALMAVGSLDSADLCLAPASFGFPSTSLSRKKSAPKAKKTSKFAGFFSKSLFVSAAAAPPKQQMKKKSDRRKAEAVYGDPEEDDQLNSPVMASSASAPPAQGSSSQKTKGAPAVLSLISLQKASGAWDLTDQLVSLCSTSRDALITGCPAEIAVDKAEGKLLWATALALVLLMGKFLDQKDEWEMIAEKGKKWMKKNLPAAVTYDKVLEAAATAVGVQI